MEAEDRDYLAILRPYAEGRFSRNEAQKQAFYDMALSRKRNVRLILSGGYSDRFERVDGKWRFAKRMITNVFYGDMSAHTKSTSPYQDA